MTLQKMNYETFDFLRYYFSAQQVLRAARELVDASEKSMMKDPTDLKWLEVLNEANEKTNQVKNKYVY